MKTIQTRKRYLSMNVTMVVSFLILLLVLVFNYAQAQSNTDYAKSFYIYGGGGPGGKSVVGIHLEVQCLAAKGIAGIGITPFVDINSEFTYGGLTIGIALGKVHYRK